MCLKPRNTEEGSGERRREEKALSPKTLQNLEVGGAEKNQQRKMSKEAFTGIRIPWCALFKNEGNTSFPSVHCSLFARQL